MVTLIIVTNDVHALNGIRERQIRPSESIPVLLGKSSEVHRVFNPHI